jgi:thiol-disulfide isomerase/thioredoxin
MTLAPWLLVALLATSAEPTAGAYLLDFTATWCPPCQATRPEVERLRADGYPIREVDVDDEPELAKRYRISGIPTFIVVDRDGTERARTTGAKTAGELARFYDEHAGTAPRDRSSSEARETRDDASEESTAAPWETVVRIKVLNHLSRPRASVGFGSGTIIHSTERESIILTCAHIFHIEELRKQPAPSRFPLKVKVDLFDGRLGPQSPGKSPQVHTTEVDIPAEVIDYDYVGDVGLLRIRPGRRLPVSKIVPPGWTPKPSMKMTTVGCSHGHDATAWTTEVTRPLIRLQKSPSDIYEATECAHKPMQGRSGGGLFTLDGLLAGVCDFNDGRSRGLYASPNTIHRLIDKHELQICYADDPDRARARGMLLANRRSEAGRGAELTIRGQSPSQDSRVMPVPPPELMNVRLPGELLEDEEDVTIVRRPNSGGDSWKARGEFVTLAERDSRSEALRAASGAHATAGLQMQPSADGDIFAAAPDFDQPDTEPSDTQSSPSHRPAGDSWRAVSSQPARAQVDTRSTR